MWSVLSPNYLSVSRKCVHLHATVTVVGAALLIRVVKVSHV